jgi:hypothetical protein
LYSYDTLLEGLAQHLQDVATELREFIQQQHPVVRQGHLSWQWHLAAPDQPHIGDRVRRGATRAHGDQGEARKARGGEDLGRLRAGRMVVRRRASLGGYGQTACIDARVIREPTAVLRGVLEIVNRQINGG